MAKRITQLLNEFQTTIGSREGYFTAGAKLSDTVNLASRQLQNLFLGYVQDYRMGTPNPAIQSQASFDVVTLLKPFKKVVTSNILDSQNFRLVVPSGKSVAKIEAIWITGTKSARVVFPPENRLASYLDNPNRLPTLENPIGEDVDDEYYKVYPAEVQQISFKLYYTPDQIDVVMNSNGSVNDALTTEMQWSERAIPFLHWKMCELIGIQVSNPMLIQSGVQESNRSI